MFHIWLEEPTELTESCHTHSYSLLQTKATDENQPREELHGTASRKVANAEPPAALSQWGQTVLTLSDDVWQCVESIASQRSSSEPGGSHFPMGLGLMVMVDCPW